MKHEEYTIDASGRSLGRVVTEAAVILRGKNKPDFQPNQLPKNKVTVINIDKVRITGKKIEQKEYKSHSGYPGSLKSEKIKSVISKKGMAYLFEKTIKRMLPANRLRNEILKNLIVK